MGRLRKSRRKASGHRISSNKSEHDFYELRGEAGDRPPPHSVAGESQIRLSSAMKAPRLLLFLGVGLALNGSLAAADDRRPNIVFIVVDDLGYGEPGCYGGK